FSLRAIRTNDVGVVYTNKFVDLKRKITIEQWGQITQAMAQITFNLDEETLSRNEKAFFRNLRRKGIYAEDDQLRVYPSGRLASHVLGYVQEVERLVTNSATRASTTDLVGCSAS